MDRQHGFVLLTVYDPTRNTRNIGEEMLESLCSYMNIIHLVV